MSTLWAAVAVVGYLAVGFVCAVVDQRIQPERAGGAWWLLFWPAYCAVGALIGSAILADRAIVRLGTPRHVRDEQRRRDLAETIARLERELGIGDP